MRKTLILSLVLLIAIVAMAIKYFSEISGNQNNLEKVLKYIPQNTALVLNFNNDASFYEIFKDYEIFDAIIGEAKAEEINQLQEFLLRQPQLTEATSGRNIFISFHPAGNDSIDFLYSMNLNEKLKIAEIEELLQKTDGIIFKKEGDGGIYSLTFKTLDKPFYILMEDGAAAGSFSEPLIRNIASGNYPPLDNDFEEELKNASSKNQNSPVNLFINHKNASKFLSHFLKGKANGNSGLLTDIKGISSLNMNFKSDALMFNGISKPDTGSAGYLNTFLGQQAVNNDIKNIIPDKTANFLAFGLSNYNTFKQKLSRLFASRDELKRLQNQLNLIKEKSGIDLEKDLKPLIGNEFAIIETSGREKFGIIKVKNGRKLNFTLQLISSELNSLVSRTDYSHILYNYLGDPFKSFVRPYFTVVDNYLIVANTSGILQTYLKIYEDQKFLIKTPDFSKYNQLVANQSNILYFIHAPNSERTIKTSLKNTFVNAYNSDNYGLKNFYGISYQWGADGDHFYTNVYINYISDSKKELKEIWKVKLNGRLAITPQLLNNGDKQIILAQDKSNTLYAVSSDGEKLWSTQLTGKVLGEFRQLNDNSVVFNTQNKLYRLNNKGESFDGFPVSLPFNSSYGLSISGRSPADLKIFIPASNYIMGYDANGETLSNWNKPVDGKILFDIKLTSLNSVNYVITGTQKGNFYFFNQNGDLIKSASHKSTFSDPISLRIGNTPNESQIITVDSSGSFTSISFEGSVKQKNIFTPQGDFSFDYKNITGDDSPELIYLDKTGLNVYSADGNPIFNYTFSAHIKTRPLYFPVNNYKFQLGINNSQNSQILLLGEDGSPAKGFPVKGDGYFLIAKIRHNGYQYLICGDKENFLSAYRL